MVEAKTEQEVAARSGLFFRLVDWGMLSLFYLTRFFFLFIPASILNAAFDKMGSLIFYARSGMRERLLGKLSDALPEIEDREELEYIGKHACGSFLRPIYDLNLFARYGDRFMRELNVEGMENLEKAEAADKGVILVGGNLGAASLRLAVLTRLGKSYTALIYKPEDSPLSGYMTAMTSFGADLGHDVDRPVIWAGRDTIPQVYELLQQGGKVAINFDVDGSTVVDFFGYPAAMASGIAHFARKTGAAIVPFAIYRGRDVFGHHLVIHEPIAYEITGDEEHDVESIMSKVMEAGEAMIREAPEQWMSWFGLWQFWAKAAEIEP